MAKKKGKKKTWLDYNIGNITILLAFIVLLIIIIFYSWFQGLLLEEHIEKLKWAFIVSLAFWVISYYGYKQITGQLPSDRRTEALYWFTVILTLATLFFS